MAISGKPLMKMAFAAPSQVTLRILKFLKEGVVSSSGFFSMVGISCFSPNWGTGSLAM